MRPRDLVPLLVMFFLGLTSCSSDDDGGSPSGLPADTELQSVAECAAWGIKNLGLALETSLYLFHELDQSGYQSPLEFHYDPDTGEYTFQRVIEDDPRYPTRITGVVEPLSVVANGLQQDDIFTLTWTARLTGESEDCARGTFRVIHYGLTLPPNQTETMRLIPAAAISCGHAGDCFTEFSQLEVIVHHLRPTDEIRSALTTFRCTNAGSKELVGSMTASAASNVASVTGTFDGATYTCSIDLDTYVIDCGEQ